MKKLNINLINEDLFITGEEVYGKEIIDQLRELIYNIGWYIIIDKYLDNEVAVEDDSLDHMWK